MNVQVDPLEDAAGSPLVGLNSSTLLLKGSWVRLVVGALWTRDDSPGFYLWTQGVHNCVGIMPSSYSWGSLSCVWELMVNRSYTDLYGACRAVIAQVMGLNNSGSYCCMSAEELGLIVGLIGEGKWLVLRGES